jgi:hypothetical protein
MSSGGPLDGHKNELTHRIRDARAMPEKSPVLAGLFAVVPGGGFLYTGRIKDAAAAFLLNAGLGLAAWKAFDQGNPALGAVVGICRGRILLRQHLWIHLSRPQTQPGPENSDT